MDFVRLSEDSHQLLERLADRFPPDQLRMCRSLDNAGEWPELINLMSAVLVQDNVPISRADRDDLRSLLYMYPVPMEDYDYISNRDETLAALNIQP